MTRDVVLPHGSLRDLIDPFAEKERPWKLYALGAAILVLAWYWYLGKLDPFLPGPIKSTSVLGTAAPTYQAAAPAPGVPPAAVPKP